jgi:hypothetical protein
MEEMGINYEKYILDFAQLAQNENIELLFRTIRNAGSQKTEYWSQLIKKNKKIYLETNLCSKLG